MLKRAVYGLLSNSNCRHAIRNLRMLETKLVSPKARFAIPFVFRGRGYFKRIEPRQNAFEIESLYDAVCELNPKRILEIGTARGGTLYLWTQASTDDGIIVSVDLPEGEFGGAYPECRAPFYESFARVNQKLYLLRRDSHDPKTLDQVRSCFGNQQVDYAFIDGDHTYEGVKSDFLLYGPLVRPGGLIGFHDIVARPDMPEIQVDRFWREIRQSHDSTEFIAPDGLGRKIGIGLIRVGDSGINVV